MVSQRRNNRTANGHKTSFVNRQGQICFTGLKSPSSGDTVGKAYGFFQCDYPKERVRDEILRARSFEDSSIELILTRDAKPEMFQTNPNILEAVAKSQREGRNYVLEGRLENATNQETAERLRKIISDLANTNLYSETPMKDYSVRYE